METLNIKKLSQVYHLRPEQYDLETELNVVVEEAIIEHLDQVLATLCVNSDEEICVRLLHIPLSYSYGKSRYETTLGWSHLIAEKIQQVLADGGSNVVRYPSCLHGLIDFATAYSCDDLQRAWAWNQLGWTTLSDKPTMAEARPQLVSALYRTPTLLLPIFRHLAQRGKLFPLFENLSYSDGSALLQTVFACAEIDTCWLTESWRGISAQAIKSDEGFAVPLLSFNHSAIAEQLRSTHSSSSLKELAPHRYWVILCLLEVEVSLFKRQPNVIAAYMLAANAKLFTDVETDSGKHLDTLRDRVGVNPNRDSLGETGSTNTSNSTQKFVGDKFGADKVVVDIDKALKPRRPVSGQTEQIEDMDSVGSVLSSDAREVDVSATEQLYSSIESVDNVVDPAITGDFSSQLKRAQNDVEDWFSPERYFSQWGGLFYLLPLLGERVHSDEDNILSALVYSSALSQRPITWILQHFFTTVLREVFSQDSNIDIPEDDPVLRILSNQDALIQEKPVQEKPIQKTQKVAEEQELGKQARRLIDAVQRCFADSKIDHLSTTQGLWQWLCCRNVRLQTDVAWIEVIFELEHLETAIRKAGLDLDPGYVAWLAKVVKFRYE